MPSLKYFSNWEFNCKCGKCGMGIQNMDLRLLKMLDEARGLSNTTFILTSAIRCPEHNKKVGGVPASSHLKGLAVDIKTEINRDRFLILKALTEIGFTRIGIGPSFIHVDIDPDKPDRIIWLY